MYLSLCDILGAMFIMLAIKEKVKCRFKLEPFENVCIWIKLLKN